MVLVLCISSLMLIDIYMKFHEDILNILQATEPKQFCDGQCSKGNNPKSMNARVVIFNAMLIDIHFKISWIVFK